MCVHAPALFGVCLLLPRGADSCLPCEDLTIEVLTEAVNDALVVPEAMANGTSLPLYLSDTLCHLPATLHWSETQPLGGRVSSMRETLQRLALLSGTLCRQPATLQCLKLNPSEKLC